MTSSFYENITKGAAPTTDVLSCLANLSNDEVFTPPDLVNKMLDMLPQELFSDPNTKFLDPACKTGVFLREITKRLIVGLEPIYPDLQERIDHILHEQVFGIAITELTSLLSRRSLYCSKYPNGKYSISHFDNPEGNVRFKRIKHSWVNGKCSFCGISKDTTLGNENRERDLETHAYEWIHKIELEEIFNMKFDVIISNPPYQLSTGQGQSQAQPIYHKFIQQAKKLEPRYISMIVPSRWFTGGMGLDSFRTEMLNDRRMKEIHDFSLSTTCFPGVDIAGGVNYFLWDKSYDGDCTYVYNDGDQITTAKRKLNEYEVFIRNNNALGMVKKVLSYKEPSISEIMSSLGPFGLGTAERGHERKHPGDYILLSSAGTSYIDKTSVKSGYEYINKWKVIIGKATSAGAATAGKDGLRKVIATLTLLGPESVCTFSYFVAGAFDTKEEAINCLNYYSTKFARFFLLQTLSSINISKDRFVFVPLQDFKKQHSDDSLYKKYGFTKDEINLIETSIKPMAMQGE